MKQFRENVESVLSRNARHHVHSGMAALEGHGDVNSNLEMQLVKLNVKKMRELEGGR